MDQKDKTQGKEPMEQQKRDQGQKPAEQKRSRIKDTSRVVNATKPTGEERATTKSAQDGSSG
jgi:hypothetical protein